MIGFIVFVLTLIVLGVLFGVFKKNNYIDEHDDLKPYGVMKGVGILVLSIIIGVVQPIAATRIDAGNVGIKVDRIGDDKGQPKAIPVKGLVFYNDWYSDIKEFSIRQNPVSYTKFSVTTKGGFPVDVAPSFNYALKPDKAVALYIDLLKNSDFESLQGTWLSTATSIALNNSTNRFSIDSIFNNKEAYQREVESELNKQVSKYFFVSQINPNIVPPKELADVIKNKTEAIQKAQQAELDKITAEANAQTKIAEAKGDSAQAVIKAAGQAEAVQKVQKVLSPVYVEYIKWLNANPDVPRVPNTVLGSGSSTLLNLKQ